MPPVAGPAVAPLRKVGLSHPTKAKEPGLAGARGRGCETPGPPTGRNMEEILRLIDALQTTDKHGVATPANWRPGEKVIVPPPRTVEGAEARMT